MTGPKRTEEPVAVAMAATTPTKAKTDSSAPKDTELEQAKAAKLEIATRAEAARKKQDEKIDKHLAGLINVDKLPEDKKHLFEGIRGQFRQALRGDRVESKQEISLCLETIAYLSALTQTNKTSFTPKMQSLMQEINVKNTTYNLDTIFDDQIKRNAAPPKAAHAAPVASAPASAPAATKPVQASANANTQTMAQAPKSQAPANASKQQYANKAIKLANKLIARAQFNLDRMSNAASSKTANIANIKSTKYLVAAAKIIRNLAQDIPEIKNSDTFNKVRQNAVAARDRRAKLNVNSQVQSQPKAKKSSDRVVAQRKNNTSYRR